MDTRSGEIFDFDELKDKPKKELSEFFKEIPNVELLEKLQGMNRHDRRAYYATHKKEFKDMLTEEQGR